MNGRAEKQGRTGEPKIGPLETGTWRPEYQYAPEYRFRGPINMIKSRAKLHLDFRAGLKLSARVAAAEKAHVTQDPPCFIGLPNQLYARWRCRC